MNESDGPPIAGPTCAIAVQRRIAPAHGAGHHVLLSTPAAAPVLARRQGHAGAWASNNTDLVG
jgi:hypothetical protein